MEQSKNNDFLTVLTDPALLYENAPCGYLSFTSDGRIFMRKDSSTFPALINSSVFHDPTGKLIAVNATVYNISDRKKYETELLEAKKQADPERLKFEFLSDFISAEIIGDMVKISVRDHGQGIPKDRIPYLFDRYYRADYTGGSASGLGLGLYTCSEIIRRHGGKIGVDSELGAGSTFWFTLPLKYVPS